jgi:phosphoenolpyruvate carboxylase
VTKSKKASSAPGSAVAEQLPREGVVSNLPALPGRRRHSPDSFGHAFLALDPESEGITGPLAEDIRMIDRLLGDTLQLEGDGDVIGLARHLMAEAGTDADPEAILDRLPGLSDATTMRKVLRAFTVLFQTLNLVEQKEIVRANRARAARHGDEPRPESIAEAVLRLARSGYGPAEIQSILDRVEIRPTLTAHPTEARRRAVMDKLLAIADGLTKRALPAPVGTLDTPLDNAGIEDRRLHRLFMVLWNTDELRQQAVTVEDEVHNALYFLQRTILDVVPWLHDDLHRALDTAFPGQQFRIPAFIKYHSWVGGDRDGNPNVTPKVTWDTVLIHARVVLRHYIRRLAWLRRSLSMSARLLSAGAELRESLEKDLEDIAVSPSWKRRLSQQPFALKLTCMLRRARLTLKHMEEISRLNDPRIASPPPRPGYECAEQLLADLEILQSSLRDGGAAILADGGSLAALSTQVRTFGFHLATLDVRQHSNEHSKAMDELFGAAGVTTTRRPYSGLSEEEKVRLLTSELQSPRPLLPHGFDPGDTPAGRVLATLGVIMAARRTIGHEACSCYIISMTHQVSDLLEVLVLAKEAGLVRWIGSEHRYESDLDIVPLFETIEDLAGCDGLMKRLFANEGYRRHLEARHRFQEIMLGYSDSSKDGGYLAANWSLFDTQARLAAVCRSAKVDWRFFHGRGGTVGRGGGRAGRAISGQPPRCFTGRIRFTEQGEVVSFRYGLRPLAHRHLEQIASAVIVATAEDSKPAGRGKAEYHAAMAAMAENSRLAYRSMIHEDPDFWPFYVQGTPIAHISRLPIASRPAMRNAATMVGLDELRAIPWVFAWVQSRYMVPGWYGLGSGLAWFASLKPGNAELLKKMYHDWLFFRTVIDNAQMELLRAHLPTARLYAALVRQVDLRHRVHAELEAEYERTVAMVLRITGKTELLEHAPVVRNLVRLRNPVTMPLNRLQVALMSLCERRKEGVYGLAPGQIPPSGTVATSPWYEALLLSIAGIAAGMQSTG